MERTAKLPGRTGGAVDKSAPGETVSVVITAYNHAHFLDDALRSVFSQTRLPDHVIVIDDGSQDDPGAVASGYPGVQVVRQANAGLAAARNAGLHANDAGYIVFLDADDMLSPVALECGLRCFAENPDSGMVYGAHRRVDAALAPMGPALSGRPGGSPYHALLRGNFIGMHAAVMYDRAKLAECGGFDSALKRCEDYDVYFRMALRHPVASHPGVVADYRIHGKNMSADHAAMLDAALVVQQRYRPSAVDRKAMAAYRAGQRHWRLAYALADWRRGSAAAVKDAARKQGSGRSRGESLPARLRPFVPQALVEAAKRLIGGAAPRFGAVDMGDLARAKPIGLRFGYDRGTPVDRWYIERFLTRHAPDIRGRVLEVGDAAYSRRFGIGLTRQDVLHVSGDSPEATIVGDLSQPGLLPGEAFDCLLISQTLHLIFDLRAAVAELRRALAPNGVLLLTVPGVSSIDRGEWKDAWLWSLTEASARRLFGEAFGAENVEIASHGNVYAATCFLHGLAAEEVDERLLEHDDPAYPLVVCVRAHRAD